MEAPGDKMATTHAKNSNKDLRPTAQTLRKHGKPVAMARFGAASVPVYRCDSGGRIRFAISHYRDGKRLRHFFPTLEAAKKEAQLVAPIRMEPGWRGAKTAKSAGSRDSNRRDSNPSSLNYQARS